MISIQNLVVQYGKKRAIDHINLNIEKGESVLVAGANGSGKTTLLRSIANVLFPSQGGIFIDGKPVGTKTRRMTAFIPASISFYESLSLKEAVRLHGTFYRDFSYQEIGEFKPSMSRKISTLSRGEKTLFFLSLALSSHPDYLLVDDVIHFLDPHLRDFFLKSILHLIGENQLSIIVAAQSSFDIEGIFERVVILARGKVIIDQQVEALKKACVKIYSETAQTGLPIVYQRSWDEMTEQYIYPYSPEMGLKSEIHYLRLSEILRAFIGGEYGSH